MRSNRQHYKVFSVSLGAIAWAVAPSLLLMAQIVDAAPIAIGFFGKLYDVEITTGALSNPRGGFPESVFAAGIARSPVDDEVYVITTGSGSTLYTLDPVSGSTTEVGPLGLSFVAEGGIAFDPLNGVLYGIQRTNGSNSSPLDLFTVDLSTGDATVVGSVTTITPGTPADLSGIAFDSSGTLYVLDTTNLLLHRIDPSTGAIITSLELDFGGADIGAIAGMGFNPDNDSLYVADGSFTDFPEAGGTDTLYAINTVTGNATAVGATGVVEAPVGLAFEQAATPIPAASDWGMVTMALLMLTAGTIVHGLRGREDLAS